MVKAKQQMSWLQTNTVRVARLHFVYVFMYALLVIAYDAWNLITAQALVERWTLAVTMLVITTVVWFIARNTALQTNVYRAALATLILLDIYVAGFAVYSGRGMASRGVALFAIPIVISIIYKSRSVLFAVSSLCLATYSYALVRYFGEHPSEGYNIELYADLAFYGASFFLLSALLWVFARSVQARNS